VKWLTALLRGKRKRPVQKERTEAKAGDITDNRMDISQREAAVKSLSLKKSLPETLKLIREISGAPGDLTIREFRAGREQVEIALLHLEGFVDNKLVENILRMLGLGSFQAPVGRGAGPNLLQEFHRRLLPSAETKEVATVDDLWSALTNGCTVILCHGSATGLACDTWGFKYRNIEEPSAESTIRGPRDGFIESFYTNVALLRKRIKTPNLWLEEFTLGSLSRTKVGILYIKGLASEELVQEVRQRVSRIKIDAIIGSGFIEDFIEDNPFSIFPLLFQTERPDRVTGCLLEGRVAIITENTPFVLVAPMDFPMLLQAPDDYYEKMFIGSFLRLLRYFAFGISVFLPGIYVAVIVFHNELLQAQLLLRIAAAKEGVPFPVVAEVFLMEILFELLREAGIRLPRAIGPAISIVGALVLGDAAIRAGLVSPPVVIIVSLTAIASFTVPTFSFGIAARLLRFIFIFLGGAFGLFGIQFGGLLVLIYMSSVRSFGYPYLAPVAPLILKSFKDLAFRAWWWRMNTRPLLLGAREPVRQPRGQQPRPDIEEEEKEKTGKGRKNDH
jgi:spore germination protein KA